MRPTSHPTSRYNTVAFFKNIRQRRLFQIVAGYAAAGFVVLEGVDQLVGNEILPPFLYGIALTWYLGGFAAAGVIGWYHGERGDQTAPRSEVAILSVLGVVVLTLTGIRVNGYFSERSALQAAAASALDLRRVAVTYFRDQSPGEETRHIADALTEDLIQELSRVRALDVVSRNGVAPFRDAEVQVDSVARALRAGTVVGGTVEQVGEVVRVNVRLHDGQSGAEFRRASFERPAAELLEARQEVAEETARFLREWLGAEIELRERERDTEDLAAWALVQRGEKARKDAERLAGEHDAEGADRAFDEADRLLAQAHTVDPRWAEPAVLRSLIAYRRSRLAHDPHDAEPWIERGLEHAETALRVEPANARALELRGTLRYLRYLLPLVPDEAERQALFEAARADLEEAVRLDPTLASAHSTLSHLYAWIDDLSASLLAAQRAYEEDAYLETADLVVWRLVTGHYDQESFEQSKRWCDLGRERFPGDARFVVECELMLMTTRAVEPDVERAWRLVALVDSVAPESQREAQNALSLIYMGGVLARAGLPDSADSVLRRARDEFRPENDPRRDLYLNEAAIRATVLGDVDGAIDLLKAFAAVNPGYTFEHSWWWRSVRNHPRYAELTAFQSDH